MSYLGNVRLMTDYCNIISKFKTNNLVSILEVGVDQGQTLLPLVHNLIYDKVKFHYIGVDILWNKDLAEQLNNMGGVVLNSPDGRDNVSIFKQNSLDFLPMLISESPDLLFDLVLLDGDHNYETVFKEMEHLGKITHDHSLCIADDYNGKWSGRDGFYMDHVDHKKDDHKKLKRDRGRQGVNNAIDDYVDLDVNGLWTINNFDEADPVYLTRKGLLLESLNDKDDPKDVQSVNMTLLPT